MRQLAVLLALLVSSCTADAKVLRLESGYNAVVSRGPLYDKWQTIAALYAKQRRVWV